MGYYDLPFAIATVIGAVGIGLLAGLVPLIVGIIKKKIGLAIGGFFACIVGGLVLGLILSVPLAVLFTVLIVTSSNKDKLREQQELYNQQMYYYNQQMNQQQSYGQQPQYGQQFSQPTNYQAQQPTYQPNDTIMPTEQPKIPHHNRKKQDNMV